MIYVASLDQTSNNRLSGLVPILSKQELDKVVTETSANHKVIVRHDFIHEFFTPTGFVRYIGMVKRLNHNIDFEVPNDASLVTVDDFQTRLSELNSLDDLLTLLFHYDKEIIHTIKTMATQDVQREHEILVASSTVASLRVIIDDYKRDIDNLKYQLKLEQENKASILNQLDTLVSRINFQYDVGIDPARMYKATTHKYRTVLYIKEITRVQYMDTMLYYLKEILKFQGLSTRLLVIEPFYAMSKVALYPHLKPHYALKEGDVMREDLLMLGVQPKLLNDVLKNPTNHNLLIVLDRAGMSDFHIEGANIEYLFTASDMADTPEGVPKSRCISYGDDTLYIPLIKGFSTMDNTERMSHYSSTGIVKKLVELLERG